MNNVYADLDDIVFEDRAKDYGAYQMRKKYSRYLSRAALLAILLFLGGTSVPKIVGWFIPPATFIEDEDLNVIPVNLDAPPPDLNKEEPPPPPPELPPPPKVETIKFVVPEPDPEVSEDSTITEIDSLDKAQIDDKTQHGDKDAVIDFDKFEDPGVGDLPEPEVGPTDWVDLQEEPKPVNMEAFRQAVGYPEMAKNAEIQGKVIVRVQVDKNGNYVKHLVLKDPHPILTSAVTSKLSTLKFTPGIQAGKPVKVWVTIPVDFQLNNK